MFLKRDIKKKKNYDKIISYKRLFLNIFVIFMISIRIVNLKKLKLFFLKVKSLFFRKIENTYFLLTYFFLLIRNCGIWTIS